MEILYESQGYGLKPDITRYEDKIWSEVEYPNSTNNRDPLLYKLYLYTIENTKSDIMKKKNFYTFLKKFYNYYLPNKEMPHDPGVK